MKHSQTARNRQRVAFPRLSARRRPTSLEVPMLVAPAPTVDPTPVLARPLTAVPALTLDPDRSSLRIVAWSTVGGPGFEGRGEPDGHDPRSPYVERFWLGVLGPSTTWLLRCLAYGFDGQPDGFDLDLA